MNVMNNDLTVNVDVINSAKAEDKEIIEGEVVSFFGDVGYSNPYVEKMKQIALWAVSHHAGSDLILQQEIIDRHYNQAFNEHQLHVIGKPSLFSVAGTITPSDVKKPEWLVDGLIPKSGIGMMYGDSGTYKSFIAVGICTAILKGFPFMGHKINEDCDGKVAYISGEDANGIMVRFIVNGVMHGERLIVNKRDCNFSQVGAIKKQLSECDLVVFDTMNSLNMDVNNNDSASVTAMMDELREYGKCVLVIHHSNKTGSIEGSHAFRSNSDFVLKTELVDGDLELVELISIKQKNAAKAKPILCEMVEKEHCGYESMVVVSHRVMNESRMTERVNELNERQKLIVGFLSDNGKSTFGDISKSGCFGDVSRSTANADLAKLVDLGMIQSSVGQSGRRCYTTELSDGQSDNMSDSVSDGQSDHSIGE